jgi:hypothetical protein
MPGFVLTKSTKAFMLRKEVDGCLASRREELGRI